MPILYTRKETDNEIVIVYKYQALFYFFILFVPFHVFYPIINPLWVFILLIVFISGFWKAGREVKKAMADKKINVQISGRVLSIRNPQTFTIKK